MEIVLNRHLFKEKPLRGWMCIGEARSPGRPPALRRGLGWWQEQPSQAGMASWAGICTAASSGARRGSVREAPDPLQPPLHPVPGGSPRRSPFGGGTALASAAVLNYSSEEALWLYCFHLLQKAQRLFSEAAIWSNRG